MPSFVILVLEKTGSAKIEYP